MTYASTDCIIRTMSYSYTGKDPVLDASAYTEKDPVTRASTYMERDPGIQVKMQVQIWQQQLEMQVRIQTQGRPVYVYCMMHKCIMVKT